MLLSIRRVRVRYGPRPKARKGFVGVSAISLTKTVAFPYELGPVCWGEVSESVEGARLETV